MAEAKKELEPVNSIRSELLNVRSKCSQLMATEKDIQRQGHDVRAGVPSFENVDGKTQQQVSQSIELRRQKAKTLQDQISKIERMLASYRQQQSQLLELNKQLHALQTSDMQLFTKTKDLEKLDADLQTLKREINEAKENQLRSQESFSLIEKTYKTESALIQQRKETKTRTLHTFETSLNALLALVEKTQESVLTGLEQEMQTHKNSLALVEAKTLELSRSVKAVEIELDQNEGDGSGAEAQMIDLFLNHLKDEADISRLRQDVESLRSKFEACNLIDLKLERDQKKAELERHQKTLHTSEGELNAVRKEISDLETHLAHPDYRSVDLQYKQQKIMLEVYRATSADLETYHKSLDVSLQQFHHEKIEEINRILQEIWQATYKNQDIECIQIRSDASDSSSSSSSSSSSISASIKRSKSYNYRVVMVKEGRELDMRGRCSAGQKILASLIIRLALAETFCINCGIIALDEPTTNLDRTNVKSFASALLSVIESRRGQTSFQLVVITHDEDFVQLMASNKLASYCWRVKKDASQNSVIIRQYIDDFTS